MNTIRSWFGRRRQGSGRRYADPKNCRACKQRRTLSSPIHSSDESGSEQQQHRQSRPRERRISKARRKSRRHQDQYWIDQLRELKKEMNKSIHATVTCHTKLLCFAEHLLTTIELGDDGSSPADRDAMSSSSPSKPCGTACPEKPTEEAGLSSSKLPPAPVWRNENVFPVGLAPLNPDRSKLFKPKNIRLRRGEDVLEPHMLPDWDVDELPWAQR